jgi:SAM-dependent methyltransferase
VDPARIPYDDCPLCGHAEAEEVVTVRCAAHPLFKPGLPETMRWLGCTRCAHVFVDGYFNAAAEALLFSGANAAQLPPGPDVGGRRQVAGRMVHRVAQLLGGARGRWLDVGFGNGMLLTTAAEFGFDAVGLDVREEAVRALRALGVEAHATPLERFEAAPFRVISFADVLEHLSFPRPALARAHALLEPEGLLLVSLPNLESFAWQHLDRTGKNPYWAELEHLHNFSRRRLYALLEEQGFTPLDYAVSERYEAGMEVIARRRAAPPAAASR